MSRGLVNIRFSYKTKVEGLKLEPKSTKNDKLKNSCFWVTVYLLERLNGDV